MRKKDDKKFKIGYITELYGTEQIIYTSDEEGVRRITDDLISKGYYIKTLVEWIEAQHQYTRLKKDYLALYDSKKSNNNYIKWMFPEKF